MNIFLFTSELPVSTNWRTPSSTRVPREKREKDSWCEYPGTGFLGGESFIDTDIGEYFYALVHLSIRYETNPHFLTTGQVGATGGTVLGTPGNCFG